VCDEANDDEPVDAVPLELEIQVGVGKAARAPVFERHDIARLRGEFAANLAAPRAVLEGLSRPRGLLNRSDVLPCLVVPGTISTMQRVEHAKPGSPRGIQDLQHVRDATIGLRDTAQAIPDLAALGNEIVVRVDHQKCRGLPVKRRKAHDVSTSCVVCLALNASALA
jgi:hypothetical protein